MSKFEEIKARHARGMKGLTQTHHDRAWLIAEVERLENECRYAVNKALANGVEFLNERAKVAKLEAENEARCKAYAETMAALRPTGEYHQ